MQLLIALFCGVLFGVGLLVSQMANPDKVLSFLDISGHWDPSLLLVMASALLVYVPGYLLLVRRREKPLVAEDFSLPQKRQIDKPLLLGAVVFGTGWGLAGICPGPAVVNLSGGDVKIFAFIAFMLAGMWCSGLISRWKP
ncbi:YeeE/YedE family protein [Thalassomonas actiniarum]|uniref:YeeE/YedE family protein n=1 Tax=Thalassomonas actiniarum TaxID=485447 RepID=A0AAE9YS17_9GAMM|nr:YeeE/YedE family protein [Thalassomonas actiniarum]WDD99224.1 YeeE/YedE family protein [Thalassomonas actiniarum]